MFETIVNPSSGVPRQRWTTTAMSVAGHLVAEGSVFRLLAEHRQQMFPPAMFDDLFPSGRGGLRSRRT